MAFGFVVLEVFQEKKVEDFSINDIKMALQVFFQKWSLFCKFKISERERYFLGKIGLFCKLKISERIGSSI